MNFSNNNRGYTLLEMIVSITIIGIITGVFFANYRGGDRINSLNLAAQRLISDIRLAQSFCLGLSEFNDNIPKGGWGLYTEEGLDYYIVFADINSTEHVFDDGENYQKIELPDGILIDSIVDNTGVENNGRLDLVFTPPNPITYINTFSDAEVEITLKNEVGQTRTVKINFFGLVEEL